MSTLVRLPAFDFPGGIHHEATTVRLTPIEGIVGRRRWRVFSEHGLIGYVADGTTTFERRTRGKQYVNSRRQIREWQAEDPSHRLRYKGRSYAGGNTRRAAIAWLLAVHTAGKHVTGSPRFQTS